MQTVSAGGSVSLDDTLDNDSDVQFIKVQELCEVTFKVLLE